jgi:hypothetical protein
MAFLDLLGFVVLITLSASILCYPKAGLSILPFSPVGNGLDRQDRSPRLLSASECFRSLPVSWHPPGSPPLLTTGGWWSLP